MMSSLRGFYVVRGCFESNQDTMYVKRNMVARSCNHRRGGKQWVLHNLRVCTVYVDLGIQHAMRMLHIVICVMPRSTIFFHMSHERHDFRGGKNVTEQKMYFDSLYDFCLKQFSFCEEISELWLKKYMYVGRRALYP